MEKLCDICGKPVVSDLEGSWLIDEVGEARYFHMDCLKKGEPDLYAETVIPEGDPADTMKVIKKVPYRP